MIGKIKFHDFSWSDLVAFPGLFLAVDVNIYWSIVTPVSTITLYIVNTRGAEIND
jgi:hypothetical protein